MNNTNILELRTLDDEDLMAIVGGGQSECHPRPECQPCDVDIRIDVCLNICL